MLRLINFQNKVAEIRVEYMGRQFSTYVPPPEKCVCGGGGGRFCTPDDSSDVNTNFENF